jgi:hypothetical protein
MVSTKNGRLHNATASEVLDVGSHWWDRSDSYQARALSCLVMLLVCGHIIIGQGHEMVLDK